jgi:hypothetical protein
MNTMFARVVLVIKAAELLGLVDTPMQMVVLTNRGRQLADAAPPDRKAVWREQLLTLRLFSELHAVLQRQPDHVVESDFILETIVTRMPYENYEEIFNTMVVWAIFGDLFSYDPATHRIALKE